MPVHFHHVPGRLRIHVPSVKGSTANAQALERSLSKLNGVSRVESRTLTGSVVVHYDATAVDRNALLSALNINEDTVKQTGSFARPTQTAISHQIASKAAKAVVNFAVEKAVERGIALLIASIL